MRLSGVPAVWWVWTDDVFVIAIDGVATQARLGDQFGDGEVRGCGSQRCAGQQPVRRRRQRGRNQV